MDNRERARELDYESFAKEIAQIPVELHGIRWSSKTRSTSIKHDHAAIVEVLRRVARAAIEGEGREQLPTCERCQKSKPTVSVHTGFAGESELLCGDCIFEERCQDEDELEKLRAERVLEAAPRDESPDPICPRCMGTGKYQRFPTEPQKDCAICSGTGRIAEEAPLPTARETVNMLWSGTNDSREGSTGRVYSDPLMQKAYDEGREHGAAVSEARLRELVAKWRKEVEHASSEFEEGEQYGTNQCAAELERALESA